ncbi:MAG TPA: TIGR02444 family protein [Geminicoccaceae bacterium]|nr:TIGR02444 family protein [Geminicoccaceae bacterium]
MHWPDNPFWDYAVALYRRPGVEAACLELQARHGLDVNLVLLCCWLAARGVAGDEQTLRRVAAAAASWQAAFVRPLRAVRRQLKSDLAAPRPGSMPARWPELTSGLRGRVLALEIDGERLEQLLLAALVVDLPPTAAPGVALASANLRCYWGFAAADRPALAALLGAAFPGVSAAAVAAALERIEDLSQAGEPLPHA